MRDVWNSWKRPTAAVVFAAVLGAVAATAQEGPPRPEPTKEHRWLDNLVGEWSVEGEAHLEPGKPPVKFAGTERVRRVGGFWTTSDYSGEFLGEAFTGVFTIGYDPAQSSFVATWIDSNQSHLWQYKGSLDAAGRTLTLEGEGPCCVEQGKTVTWRDAIVIRGKDHRIFTVKIQKDGSWVTAMTLHYRRKA